MKIEITRLELFKATNDTIGLNIYSFINCRASARIVLNIDDSY